MKVSDPIRGAFFLVGTIPGGPPHFVTVYQTGLAWCCPGVAPSVAEKIYTGTNSTLPIE